MIDVSQGDCTLIRTNENKVILIDAGTGNNEDEYDYGKNVVMPYLLDHGIMKIDYMIISHFDSDHCGGMFYILENMRVGEIIIGKQAEEYENCVEFINLANSKNVKIQALQAGDRYSLGSAYVEVYFPDIDNTITENKINNNSLVFKFCYGNFSMLFTGDIEEEAEKKLVDLYGDKLKATVLKVAHHGSKSSSSQEFLECVSPKIAMIGVGENNTYGHPNEEVLERLQAIDCTVYRTDINGEIAIKLNKGKILVKTMLQ